MTWLSMISAPQRRPILLFARLATAEAPVVLVGHFMEGRWVTCTFVGQDPLEVVPLAWMPLPAHPPLEPDRPPEEDRQYALVQTLRTQLIFQELTRDARRYRWLRNLPCCSLSLSRNDDHAINYMTATDWIDDNPNLFDDVAPEEIAAMKETNTIWRLQIYPDTPVGFYVWFGASPGAAIDAAMAAYRSAGYPSS